MIWEKHSGFFCPSFSPRATLLGTGIEIFILSRVELPQSLDGNPLSKPSSCREPCWGWMYSCSVHSGSTVHEQQWTQDVPVKTLPYYFLLPSTRSWKKVCDDLLLWSSAFAIAFPTWLHWCWGTTAGQSSHAKCRGIPHHTHTNT